MTTSQAAIEGARGWLPDIRLLPSVRARIIGGFAFLCLVFALAAGLSTWQERIHRSDLQELDTHSGTATLLQEAEAQAGIAALLLQRYVIAGDDTYIPEIKEHANRAVSSLSEATDQGAPEGVEQVAVTGAGLVQATGRITALRQADNLEEANVAMEDIVPVFREFRLQLEDATENELEQVAALRKSAESAGNLAFGLLIVSGSVGITLGLGASVLIARSIIRPLSSLEATATAASKGDLSARAPATGPRELAHLGSVLNQMMSSVELRTRELREAYEELKDRSVQLTDARFQAATDPLTGLGNHRAFHKRIREEVAQVEGSGSNVGLILFDLDGFKGVNDSLGHQAGDEVLRELATAVTEVVPRESAYRYGGDEFAVLLVDADKKSAMQFAEQLRVRVETMSSPDSAHKLTVSLGVGSYPEMAESAEELIYRADMAMYWAKSTGKNRVGDWDGLLSRRTDPTPRYAGGRAPDAVASLVSALSAKDPITRDHTERCSWYAAELAQELGLSEDEVSVLRIASLLHDIGKLVMPHEVLCKPGPLDEQEWRQMREHPTTAFHILSQIEPVAPAVPAIVHHHEHFDGSGYPDGLAGHEIPLASRILMVTDAFDAMTADRPYRKALPIEAAIEELRRHAGTQFDPHIVDVFVRMIPRTGIHPLRAANGDGDASTSTSRALEEA